MYFIKILRHDRIVCFRMPICLCMCDRESVFVFVCAPNIYRECLIIYVNGAKSANDDTNIEQQTTTARQLAHRAGEIDETESEKWEMQMHVRDEEAHRRLFLTDNGEEEKKYWVQVNMRFLLLST